MSLISWNSARFKKKYIIPVIKAIKIRLSGTPRWESMIPRYAQNMKKKYIILEMTIQQIGEASENTDPVVNIQHAPLIFTDINRADFIFS